MIHPARKIDFRDLREGLLDAHAKKLAHRNVSEDGLELFCYSESCVYDRLWSPITLLARGIVLDPVGGRLVATPFPKFFNVGEGTTAIPDLAFETFEKLDGSLIVIWHYDGRWRASTKGSFGSTQAQWAMARMSAQDLSALVPGHTYLAEAIYPENRIVVHYRDEALVLLAAYQEDGAEYGYDALLDLGERLGWRCAKRHNYASVADLLVTARGLPPSEEGFVLRFADGLRLKVKGDEYRRIHALISRLTPLAMWEAMQAGDDLDAIRRDLPEEFWVDFDRITDILQKQVASLTVDVAAVAGPLSCLADKDVGLRLAEFPERVRSFIFPYRKSGGDLLVGRTRQALFRAIRPTGNRLEGYTPSCAMNRVMEETT